MCRRAGTTNGRRRGLAVRGGTGRGGRSLPEVPQGCSAEDIARGGISEVVLGPVIPRGGGAPDKPLLFGLRFSIA
jgi:hypothetical protein